jgi:hypothetical protein
VEALVTRPELLLGDLAIAPILDALKAGDVLRKQRDRPIRAAGVIPLPRRQSSDRGR